MKWEGNRESDNVEDRRGEDGGGGRGFVGGGRGIGLGTIAIALVAGWMFGINPLTVLSLLSGGGDPRPQVQQQAPVHHAPANDRTTHFARTVLADTEDVWTDVFAKNGASYRVPKMVIFSNQTSTRCGAGESAMGPFYCPADQTVYIDLDFFQTLKDQLGAPGEFAQAYVIAHEVGHHVQKLLGISDKLDNMRSRLSETQNNAMSVRLELEADCLAGVWANKSNQSRQILEAGDVESAMNAAAKIGDDALQRASRGRVMPETFTHGSSAQRMRWFNKGLEGGSVKGCDTFSARDL